MRISSKKFPVIYADPPWSFQVRSEKGEGRSAKNHYEVMGLAQIKSLPVPDIAQDDCVLLMWATMPMLREALDVIEAWGFKYKTVAFTWMKQNKKTSTLFIEAQDLFMGTGYWTRANCELCILATKGKPKRRNAGVSQAILSAVRQHSRKPEEIYPRIEKLLDGPYIELFARNTRAGWQSWGKQVHKFPATKPQIHQRGDEPAATQSPKRKKSCLSQKQIHQKKLALQKKHQKPLPKKSKHSQPK